MSTAQYKWPLFPYNVCDWNCLFPSLYVKLSVSSCVDTLSNMLFTAVSNPHQIFSTIVQACIIKKAVLSMTVLGQAYVVRTLATFTPALTVLPIAGYPTKKSEEEQENQGNKPNDVCMGAQKAKPKSHIKIDGFLQCTDIGDCDIWLVSLDAH